MKANLHWIAAAILVLSGASEDHEIAISMDGRGRCQDNIFIERLWWTIKHHYIYLHSFHSGSELRQGLTEWIGFYNHERGHSALDDRTPDELYCGLPQFIDIAV